MYLFGSLEGKKMLEQKKDELMGGAPKPGSKR
jgi:hypothetical protein